MFYWCVLREEMFCFLWSKCIHCYKNMYRAVKMYVSLVKCGLIKISFRVCAQASFVISESRFWILLFVGCIDTNTSNVNRVKMANQTMKRRETFLSFLFVVDICIAWPTTKYFIGFLKVCSIYYFLSTGSFIIRNWGKKISFVIIWTDIIKLCILRVTDNELIRIYTILYINVYGVNLYMWFHIHTNSWVYCFIFVELEYMYLSCIYKFEL